MPSLLHPPACDLEPTSERARYEFHRSNDGAIIWRTDRITGDVLVSTVRDPAWRLVADVPAPTEPSVVLPRLPEAF
jgi:hypothetical protein